MQLSGIHTQVSAIRQATEQNPGHPELMITFHNGQRPVILNLKWNIDLRHYILA